MDKLKKYIKNTNKDVNIYNEDIINRPLRKFKKYKNINFSKWFKELKSYL